MRREIRLGKSWLICAGVKDKKGEFATTHKEINLTFKEYYKELYSSYSQLDTDKTKAFFEYLNLPKLSDEDWTS